ncbi:TPA: hypothetical protein HA251_06750 [Candidatus Woesearchaeota archaeon]|nr:hypothetical protein [Candidatus Woesearchaeota archaeon]
MRRGQLEVSFQWIYVLIAGGAFLFLFLFLIKGCSDSETAAASAGSLKNAATALAGIAWQTGARMNMTMPDAQVICPASSLSLSNGDNVASMDRLPAFLPPSVGGRTRIITTEVMLARSQTPAIPLGSVLYGIDENTRYLLVTDGSGSGAAAAMATRIGVLLSHPNVRVGDAATLTASQLPRTTKTIIVARFDGGASSSLPVLPSIPSNANVYGVVINQVTQTVEFSTWNGATYVATAVAGADGSGNGVSVHSGDTLAAGAIVAGRKPTYDCGKTALVDRMHRLTAIYESRASTLKSDPGVSAECRIKMGEGHATLRTLNAMTSADSYLEALLEQGVPGGPAQGMSLLNAQDGLYIMNCPVIA